MATNTAQSSAWQSVLNGLLGTPQGNGLLSDDEKRAAQQQGLLALGAQMLQASGPSPVKTSVGQALGQGLMAGQQAQQGSLQQALQAQLMQSQIQKNKQVQQQKLINVGAGGTVIDPETGKVVYSNPANQGGQIGNYNPGDYTPGSFAKFLQTRNPADLQRYVAPANPTVTLVSGVPTVVQGSRTGGQTRVDPLSTLPTEAAAKESLAGAAAQGSGLGKAEAERTAALDGDMARIDDEIARTERLLKEFKAGKYQTGPIAGMLPNYRTSAQDLAREQGKDVVSAISSATFGALSEGERR